MSSENGLPGFGRVFAAIRNPDADPLAITHYATEDPYCKHGRSSRGHITNNNIWEIVLINSHESYKRGLVPSLTS